MSSRVIWKYEIFVGITHLMMPRGARLLTVQMQGSTMVLWAEVDPAEIRVAHSFNCVGTGITYEAGTIGSYVATVQDPAGFVWHIHDDGEP